MNFIDDALQLHLCGVLTKGVHHGAELLNSDCAIAVRVKAGEEVISIEKKKRGSSKSRI